MCSQLLFSVCVFSSVRAYVCVSVRACVCAYDTRCRVCRRVALTSLAVQDHKFIRDPKQPVVAANFSPDGRLMALLRRADCKVGAAAMRLLHHAPPVTLCPRAVYVRPPGLGQHFCDGHMGAREHVCHCD